MKQTVSSPDTGVFRPGQFVLGLITLGLAALLGWGASAIPSHAGYAGVGPNFLPWLVAVGLAVCGLGLVWQARSGGYRNMAPPSGAVRGNWPALTWVSAGVLVNAALITHIGFVFGCALCFVLAVRGLRLAEGRAAGSLRQTLRDGLIGLLITLPVFWLFTQLLAISLPGLTASGWL